MSDLVYKRVSTDAQSTARQDLVLAEAGLDRARVFEETSSRSSRIHPLERSAFCRLLDYARREDTVHISEMFRLVRGVRDILDVLDVLHERELRLTVHDGAFSAMDLTARHPQTGELLATVKFVLQSLAAAGELQRDLQRELTFDGLRAAAAAGRKGGRRPAVPAERVDEVRAAWLAGQSIASLARRHEVSRVAIRTAVADLLPDARPPATGPDLPVTMLVPGLIARQLAAVEQLDDAAAEALREGQEVRRGQGWSLHVTAGRAVHQALLDAAAGIVGETPAERKALRIYRARVVSAAEGDP